MIERYIKKRWFSTFALVLSGSMLHAAQPGASARPKGGGGLWLNLAKAAVSVGTKALKEIPFDKMADAAGKAVKTTTQAVGDQMERMQKAAEEALEKKRKIEEAKQDRLKRTLNDPHASSAEKALARQELEASIRALEESQKLALEQQEQRNNLVMDTITGVRDLAFNQVNARLNHDLDLQKQSVKAMHERKATVEAAEKTAQAYINGILNNPAKVLTLACGAIAGWFALKHGSQYINDMLRLPALAEETSLISPGKKLLNWVTGVSPLESKLSDVILEEGIAERINAVAKSLSYIVKNNSYFPSICLYGPPGTGKTMIAKRLARSSGLDYIYFGASSLEQFSSEEAIQQIKKVFGSAKSGSKKLMIIIDEAEVMLAQRGPNLSDKTRKIVTQLLTYTGTESRDYMVVYMTNRPQDLDEAIQSRIAETIEIPIPQAKERELIIKNYIDKYLVKGEHLDVNPTGLFSYFGTPAQITKPSLEENLFTEERVKELNQKLQGFSGRDISLLMISVLNTAYATEDCKLTWNMVEKVVAAKINEKEAAKKGFERTVAKS